MSIHKENKLKLRKICIKKLNSSIMDESYIKNLLKLKPNKQKQK